MFSNIRLEMYRITSWSLRQNLRRWNVRRQVREMWLTSRESEETETSAAVDGSRVYGRLERPKMWRSVEHLRSLSLSSAPEESSITERVSRDMESTLKYHQPQSDAAPSARVAFNLDEERKRMAKWTAEQERIRKVGGLGYIGVTRVFFEGALSDTNISFTT